ncbi:MAG: hypothetical protein KC503_12850, partial [Myxococcales bacterium]|nr:hypothetical protein [Myxococcales bacterium]
MISKRQPITSVLVGAAMLVAAPWSGRAARADAGAGDATATQCGAISYVGCCAAATLHYCQSGQLVQKQCSNACGWNAAFALYGCGNSTAADPSNTHARECPAGDGGLPDAAADGPPPDDSSGPDAAGLDGQGGDGAGPDAAGCGAVPYAGCCDGDTLRFCAGNVVLALSCAAGSCGWSTARGYYSCDTSGGADPSSTYLKSCAQVVGDAGLPDAPTPRDAMALPDAAADGAADAPRDQSSADAGDGGQPSADASGDADVG